MKQYKVHRLYKCFLPFSVLSQEWWQYKMNQIMWFQYLEPYSFKHCKKTLYVKNGKKTNLKSPFTNRIVKHVTLFIVPFFVQYETNIKPLINIRREMKKLSKTSHRQGRKPRRGWRGSQKFIHFRYELSDKLYQLLLKIISFQCITNNVKIIY